MSLTGAFVRIVCTMLKVKYIFPFLIFIAMSSMNAHGGGGGSNSRPAAKLPTTPKSTKGAHGGFKISLKDNMGDSHYKAEVLIEHNKLTIYLEEAYGGKLNGKVPRVKVEWPGGQRESISMQPLKTSHSYSAAVTLPDEDRKIIFHIRYDAENGLEKGKVIYVPGH